jgi:hypothetical protein
MRPLPDCELIDHRKDTPIVLVGEPHRLRGKVRLHNRAESRVVIREARLTGAPTGHLGRRAAAVESPVAMPSILAPNQHSAVMVHVAIDAHTPPGAYSAHIVLGERSYPAELHVTENVDLSVSPDTLIVENRPGTRVAKRAIFSNRGNVPVTIGNLGPVPLDEELIVCRTIRATLADAADTAKTFDDWMSAYLRQGKKQLDAIGMLWVETEGAPIVLQPGDITPVDFTVRIPDGLDPRVRYLGVAFLYEVNLTFAIVPTGSAKRVAATKPATPTKRPAATKRAAKQRRAK